LLRFFQAERPGKTRALKARRKTPDREARLKPAEDSLVSPRIHHVNVVANEKRRLKPARMPAVFQQKVYKT
jgi:hypothetical protein